MATWPASLPQIPVPGMGIAPQRNKVSFEPEIGDSIDRRRGTAASKIYQIALPPISKAQFIVFTEFFEEDLYDGVLPFDWSDPLTGELHSWKFTGDDPPYTAEAMMGGDEGLIKVSFRLKRLA